jgi:hypothetical protein
LLIGGEEKSSDWADT